MNTKTYVVLFIVILICFIFISLENIKTHENVHKAIAYNHGCINGTISLYNLEGMNLVSYFQCNEYKKNVTKEELNMKDQLDSINEIVGYNVETIVNCFMVLCIVILSISYVKD